MIYTVTLNPSIDYVMEVANYQSGMTNRAGKAIAYPGGKGINVSRILMANGVEATALGFLGGYTGEFISRTLDGLGLKTKFTPIADTTRINVKLKGQSETEINAPGPVVTMAEWEGFKQVFHQLTPADIVIFSGSAPSSLPAGAYDELIALVLEKQARFVIDTTGDDLQRALPAKPILVKPNRDEVQALFNLADISMPSLQAAGRQLIDAGAQNAIISLGGDGALLFTAEHTYFARPIVGQVKNSVGAGDSMIGGFVASWPTSADVVAAFSLGVASATATTFSDDIATPAKIKEIQNNVEVVEI